MSTRLPPVPESERAKIFGRYYRLEARRAGARANRGLGLYFCKLAAEAHGGSIELAETEADGAWQRGLNYKTLPPSVTNAKSVNLADMPSMTEVSLFSGITRTEITSASPPKPGDKVTVKASGWAWAGGGRNIVRVDLTGDDGASWTTAVLTEGKQQRFGRAWAWTFWECEGVPAVVQKDGKVHVASKAVDMTFNVQPESSNHTWNVRGLGNNSWYRTAVSP